jgi:hypothetical protein
LWLIRAIAPKGVDQGESTTQREETLRLRGGCPGERVVSLGLVSADAPRKTLRVA